MRPSARSLMKIPSSTHVRLAPVLLLLLLLGASSCSMLGLTGGGKKTPPAGPAVPAFVNRVWRVVEPSPLPAGTLYVFLVDNTLLITPPNGTPRVDRWLMANGQLVVIQAGLRYPTDVIELTDTRFVIRQHKDAESVTIPMVLARSE